MHFYPFENVREVESWGKRREGLDIIYLATPLCEMRNTDGVVKKNKSRCDCNIAARCSAMLSKPQTFTNTKHPPPPFSYINVTIHPYTLSI